MFYLILYYLFLIKIIWLRLKLINKVDIMNVFIWLIYLLYFCIKLYKLFLKRLFEGMSSCEMFVFVFFVSRRI